MIIKVCGMRNPENIRAVEQLNMDWMGFIFYPQSKRYVPDNETLVHSIRQCKKIKVGVFVNTETDEILEKAAIYQLDMIQLHGKETVSQCRKLKEHHYQVIKAFSIESAVDLKMTHAYKDVVDFFLFDTKCEGYGGSGKRFDWSVLEAYREDIPFLLSGGISLDQITDINRFQHDQMKGIDVNSGVEIEPALKDIEKLHDLITQLKKNSFTI